MYCKHSMSRQISVRETIVVYPSSFPGIPVSCSVNHVHIDHFLIRQLLCNVFIKTCNNEPIHKQHCGNINHACIVEAAGDVVISDCCHYVHNGSLLGGQVYIKKIQMDFDQAL